MNKLIYRLAYFLKNEKNGIGIRLGATKMALELKNRSNNSVQMCIFNKIFFENEDTQRCEWFKFLFTCGEDGTRTHDLLTASQAL